MDISRCVDNVGVRIRGQSGRVDREDCEDTWVYKFDNELVDALGICMRRVSALFVQLDGPDLAIKGLVGRQQGETTI